MHQFAELALAKHCIVGWSSFVIMKEMYQPIGPGWRKYIGLHTLLRLMLRLVCSRVAWFRLICASHFIFCNIHILKLKITVQVNGPNTWDIRIVRWHWFHIKSASLIVVVSQEMPLWEILAFPAERYKSCAYVTFWSTVQRLRPRDGLASWKQWE